MQQEGGYNNVQDNSPGRPIQLIRIKGNGKIEVDQTALDIISNCDMPVGFCCVAGKYRTGKSFLLNRILKL
jgi:protein tyrosine/serine phosphatase